MQGEFQDLCPFHTFMLTGKEKHVQEDNSVSFLTAITVCSLFIIGCMLLFLIRRTCHPKRGESKVLLCRSDRVFPDYKSLTKSSIYLCVNIHVQNSLSHSNKVYMSMHS